MDLDRTYIDHRVMDGVPCVAGTRIPVATVVGMVVHGLTTDQIPAEYLSWPLQTCRLACLIPRGPSTSAGCGSGSLR